MFADVGATLVALPLARLVVREEVGGDVVLTHRRVEQSVILWAWVIDVLQDEGLLLLRKGIPRLVEEREVPRGFLSRALGGRALQRAPGEAQFRGLPQLAALLHDLHRLRLHDLHDRRRRRLRHALHALRALHRLLHRQHPLHDLHDHGYYEKHGEFW